MKIHIHQKYNAYKDLISAIPESMPKQEDVFCDNRNVVYKTDIGGKVLVVKKYKKPTRINCFVYTFFRKGKAQRAFENAEKLLEKGVETAFPVAYITIKKWGLYHTSYFVSEFLPYKSLAEAYTQAESNQEREQLTKAFIDFQLRLHSMCILQKDNNPGNTLAYKAEDGWHFALIDINRMEFGKEPDLRKSMRAFEQLGLDLRNMVETLPQYTEKRGFNLEDCVLFILRYRKLTDAVYRLKKYVKRLFRPRKRK